SGAAVHIEARPEPFAGRSGLGAGYRIDLAEPLRSFTEVGELIRIQSAQRPATAGRTGSRSWIRLRIAECRAEQNRNQKSCHVISPTVERKARVRRTGKIVKLA